MKKPSPIWLRATRASVLLTALLAGCASPQTFVPAQLPPAAKPQAPADLMKVPPPPSSFLAELKNAFTP